MIKSCLWRIWGFAMMVLWAIVYWPRQDRAKRTLREVGHGRH
jgi:hypothetical protein